MIYAMALFGMVSTLLGAIAVIPLWRVLSRIGFAGAWSLAALVPFGGPVLLWVVAFTRWPASGTP